MTMSRDNTKLYQMWPCECINNIWVAWRMYLQTNNKIINNYAFPNPKVATSTVEEISPDALSDITKLGSPDDTPKS